MPEVTNDEQVMQRAVECLRTFIRDKKRLNHLLMGEYESTDEELRQSIVHALVDWNTSPPPLRVVSLKNHPAKPLLLQCAAINALTSAGIWHSREHMPSSDGGTSGDDHAKAGEYTGWIQNLVLDYEKKRDNFKVAQNIRGGYANMGLSSEYALSAYGLSGVLW